MNPRPATVATLFRTELRMVFRDRRILVTSILLPVLLTPLLFLGSHATLKNRQAKLRQSICRYALSGPRSADARRILATASGHPLTSQKGGGTGLKEVSCEHPLASLAKGDIEVVVETLSEEDAISNTPSGSTRTNVPSRLKMRRGSKRSVEDTARDSDEEGELRVAGGLAFRIVFRADRDFSSAGMGRMSEALRNSRREIRAELLQEHGFPLPPDEAGMVKEIGLASSGHAAGLMLGKTITLLLLFFILTGGAVVAIDTLAGEKERGTLETLLTTSVHRVEIIAAKQLVIFTVASLITFIQILNLLIYIGLKIMPVSINFAAAIPPHVALILFILFLPIAALAASALLLISGYSKTYKEAGMYFVPVFLVGLVPAIAPFLPSLALRSAICFVPVANIALAARGILVGSFDWPMIAISWVVTAAAAGWTMRAGVRALSNENLITSSGQDVIDFTGGQRLFGRRVLTWFAVMWAVLLIVSNYLAKADLRVQLFINLVALFFGGTCLMLRVYKLDLRTTLALRLPKPAVWLAVLFAVPGGLFAASGVFRLANLFVPASTKMLKEFDQAVIPADISAIQLLFWVSILPGIFEEITFRGLLLNGLSRRMHPAAVALMVGVIFGLFHVALFRFAPTACLGVMLAAMTMLTGSIFPAMLWHSLSNATSLLCSKMDLPIEDLDVSSYLIGTGILAAAFWIVWRNRTPYPGLRPWKT